MRIFKAKTVQEAYSDLIISLLTEKNLVGKTYEINNCCLVVEKPSIDNYYLPFRHLSEAYLNAELKWYWYADNSCETIGQHAKMWLSLSDDGKTSNSAYGYIMQEKYNINMIEQIITLLKKDPTSRRAVINISDPAIDRINTKDMQCTIAIQFLIRNGKLEETVYMRSNDVYFGFPYDYFYFMTIGLYIAKKLKLKMGTYTHHATSMHMYLKDVKKFTTEMPEKVNVDWKKIVKDCYERRIKQ